MATRFYFPEAEVAIVSPTISATDWVHTNAVRRRLARTPDASALSTVAYTPDAADDLTDRNSHHRQYISDPLEPQTISGNLTGQFQCSETFNNDNLFLTLKLYVVSNDGTSVTGSLLAITRDTTTEFTTSLVNKNFPSTALSSLAVNNGDRLVVEVGAGGSITTGAGGTIGHNASIRWGCVASSGDLPENDSEAGVTFRPWIEISVTVLAQVTEERHNSIFRPIRGNY